LGGTARLVVTTSPYRWSTAHGSGAVVSALCVGSGHRDFDGLHRCSCSPWRLSCRLHKAVSAGQTAAID